MRVAFLTDSARADLTADDRLAVAPLAARGVRVLPVVWGGDCPDVDAIVVRSPWDYFHHLPAFLGWVDRLRAPVWNPPALLRWNTDKSYLFDLAARGVAIVPTLRVRGGDPLAPALVGVDAPEVVVKPEVSAGGFATFRLDPRDSAVVARVEAEVARVGGVFHVQPFLPTVATEGELSLVWLGHGYSHTVAKRPAPGGFLVQEDHGGTHTPVDPPDGAKAAAERVIAALGAEVLYARVDLLRDGATWRLVELELVEPSLFLRHDPDAPRRFADAIVAFALR